MALPGPPDEVSRACIDQLRSFEERSEKECYRLLAAEGDSVMPAVKYHRQAVELIANDFTRVHSVMMAENAAR